MREKAVQVCFRVNPDKELYNRFGFVIKNLYVVDGYTGEIFSTEDIDIEYQWMNEKWYSVETELLNGRNKEQFNKQLNELVQETLKKLKDLDFSFANGSQWEPEEGFYALAAGQLLEAIEESINEV